MFRCSHCSRPMPPQCRYCAICGARLPATLQPGQLVDARFKVVRLLTVHGLHTSTFQATEVATGEHVTLREFRDDLRNGPAAKQELLEELRRIGAFNLPGIPPVKGFVRHEDRAYLIAPYVAGHTLRQILGRQGRLTADQALTVLRAVATVLVGLHDLFPPQLHLDLTPDTILLAGWTQAHLLEGAWIKDLGNPFPHRPAPHVVEYAAPEALRGQPVPASDIYSLGLSVLEGVTGLPAARLYNPFANKISWEALPHAGLNGLLAAMVDFCPASRLGTARDLVLSLDRVARGEPFQAPGGSASAASTTAAAAGQPPPAPPPGEPVLAPIVAGGGGPARVGYVDLKLTAAAASDEDIGVRIKPPPPPPPAPVPPPPAAAEVAAAPESPAQVPPPVEEPQEPQEPRPVKLVDNIDEISLEEGLAALISLYEAQNT